MYLEIDQGNTRLKWRFEGGSMCIGTVERLQKQLQKTNIRSVRLVSVCSHARRQHLINNLILCAPQPLDWRIAKSSAQCMQVVNGYSEIKQLGADRWSALVAAATDHQKPGKAIAVLGCGSALTFDLIDARKRHLGGLIAPGYIAIQHGLKAMTNLTDFDYLHKIKPDISLGENTLQAIECGLTATVSGFVDRAVAYCAGLYQNNWQLVIHGGDAPIILPVIRNDFDVHFCPELVLDGLKYITCDECINA